MNQQAERRVGSIIGGKWRVDALLGSGSMAAVYAVTHRNGARSALKILHPTLCTDPAVCERFLGEGYLANSVKHSGIVRVLDDGITDDGCVFLVMDLLEGETLEALRQRRGNRLSIPEALDLADKLMDVLSAVHAAGIIHRDLKPQNVFVCSDGTLKLLDFGVARVFDRTSQSKLSMFGLVLGTPSFMSPEQALGSRDKVDHRSDIWSLGATIFTALTGETVHLGANVQAKLLAAATVKARSISMVMPDLPGGIAAVIDMALRFKKEDRWQSVDAMRRALREARATSGYGAPAAAPARAFDMSLDESTHVDKGGPSAFDGSATMRADPGQSAHGPDGTFIGMGSEDGSMRGVVGNDGSVPPMLPPGVPPPPAFVAQAAAQPSRPPMKSIPPPLPPRARMASIPAVSPSAAPQAVVNGNGASAPPVRIATSPDPIRASRPDGQEGSLPAYGSTLKLDVDPAADADLRAFERRKGNVGVWLAAVALAAAALGGIAFFAVKRGPLAPSPAGSVPAPPATSTTASSATTTSGSPTSQLGPGLAPTGPRPTPPAPTAAVVELPGDDQPAATVAVAPSDDDPPPAPRPTHTSRPHVTHHTAPRPTATATATQKQDPPDPTPTATATEKPTPPGLAPDPFGTPE